MVESLVVQARDLGGRVGVGDRGLLIGIGLLAAVAILGIAQLGAGPQWTTVLRDAPLASMSEVTRVLDEAEVAYELGGGGAELRVRDQDLARARVLLAKNGLPASGRPGFELFDEQPAWGMTDFTQRLNYRRALEGELARTISEMDGIESAQVHLGLEESSVLRRADGGGEASVVLRVRPGGRSAEELVPAVTFLVASSVDGLQSDKVTVLDHTGRLLSKALEPNSPFGLADRRLEIQREVERHLERRAEDLLVDVVGTGNIRVRVAANLSFDQVDRTIQTVDPEQQLLTREERTEIIPGPGQEGASSVASSATYETTRQVESFSSAGGSVERLTVSVLLNEDPEAPREAESLARIETLVRNAVGIDDQRGDAITVVSVPFNAPPAPPVMAGPGWLTILQEVQRPGLTALALLLAFAMGLKVLKAAREAKALDELEAGAAAELAAPADAAKLEPAEEEDLWADEEPTTALRRARVTNAILERPQLATRVVRAWMRED